MLCWLPERKCFLPSLLSELLTASTMFLSSTTPKLDEIKSVDQFGALIGFSCASGMVKNCLNLKRITNLSELAAEAVIMYLKLHYL